MLRIKSNLKPASGAIASAPLIDVIFLLLIFFVLNSSLVFQPGITMELPETMNDEMFYSMIPAKKMVLVISGQREGETGEQLMFFNNRQVRVGEFERVFREEIRKNHELIYAHSSELDQDDMPVLLLMADISTPHGLTSRVRSLAKKHGVTVFDVYGTKKPGSGSVK